MHAYHSPPSSFAQTHLNLTGADLELFLFFSSEFYEARRVWDQRGCRVCNAIYDASEECRHSGGISALMVPTYKWAFAFATLKCILVSFFGMPKCAQISAFLRVILATSSMLEKTGPLSLRSISEPLTEEQTSASYLNIPKNKRYCFHLVVTWR